MASVLGGKTIFRIKVVTSSDPSPEPGDYLLVKAFADITALGIPQTVSSRGTDHIDATQDRAYLDKEADSELVELKNIPSEPGFANREIMAAMTHTGKEGVRD
jgi:hypothetical protein